MADVLRVSNLTKQYGTGAQAVIALDGVDLTVERGCLLAIMGASGSGKSTMLHLLGGLDLPTAGRVEIEGHDLSAMSDRERTLFRRRHVGVIFQSFNLLDTLTAVENAALPLMIDGQPRESIDEKTRRMLDAVDMSHRRSHRPQALSGGEQQRIAIARALINDPAIILADEPTGNLDSKHSEEIWQLLAGLTAEQARTVIAVTHEPTGAAHADRIIVLRDGRMVGELPLETKGDASLVATSYAKLAG